MGGICQSVCILKSQLKIKSMILIIQNGYLESAISTYIKDDFHIVKSYNSESRNNERRMSMNDLSRSYSISSVANSDLDTIDLSNYSLVIILGGHQSVINIDKYKSLQSVINLIDRCYKINKPVLGICLGSQLIAYYRECEIKRCDNMKVGYDVDIEINNVKYHNVFRSHVDHIIPNDKIEVLYSWENMPYLIKSGCLLGIQCHPDIPPTEVSRFININKLKKRNDYSPEEIHKNNQIIIDELIKMIS